MDRTEPRWTKATLAGPRSILAALAACLGVAPLLLAARDSHAAAPTSLPSDGSVAFVYSKSASVTSCSQKNEAEVRDLVTGVVHLDPFVPAGSAAPFTLRVEVDRQAAGLVRATFSLYDKDGAPQGSSVVEDATCDGAHLKLVASIALLLQPGPGSPGKVCPPCPEAGCDPACRTAVRIALRDEVTRQVRADELPRIREEVKRELEARSPPPSDWHAVIAGGALFGFNYAADPAPGFWLSGEARSSMWSVGLEARGLFPTRAFVLADGSTVDVNGASGLLVPCIRWRWIGGCALAELGGTWVAGPADGDPKGVLFSLGARARLDVPIALGLEARVFGELLGHLVGLSARGMDTTGQGSVPYAFEAPRRISAFVGVGLGRSF